MRGYACIRNYYVEFSKVLCDLVDGCGYCFCIPDVGLVCYYSDAGFGCYLCGCLVGIFGGGVDNCNLEISRCFE